MKLRRALFLFVILIWTAIVTIPSAECLAITELASGSGFIVSPDGYILTNAHVVQDATEITVVMAGADQVEFEASVVQMDEVNDLALLKVEASGLPSVKLGNSDSVRILDRVLAMGFPSALQYGRDLTSAEGQITSIRTNVSGRAGEATFQTDAAIYHGSSGGPLFNMKGEVIGVNFAGIEGSEFYFAIPANNAISLFELVPGFDTSTMGTASQELSPKEIVEAAAPTVVYILVEIITPLADFLPRQALGSALEIWQESVPVPSGGLTLDFKSRCRLRTSQDPFSFLTDPWAPYWTDNSFLCLVGRALEDAGLTVEHAAEATNTASFGQISRYIRVMAFELENEFATNRAQQLLSVPEKLSDDDVEYKRLLSDAKPLGDAKLNIVVWARLSVWTRPTGGYYGELTATPKLRGVGTFTLGDLLFVVYMSEGEDVDFPEGWSGPEISWEIREGGIVVENVVESIFTGERTTYTHRTRLFTQDFVNDFEQLINTAIQAVARQ